MERIDLFSQFFAEEYNIAETVAKKIVLEWGLSESDYYDNQIKEYLK